MKLYKVGEIREPDSKERAVGDIYSLKDGSQWLVLEVLGPAVGKHAHLFTHQIRVRCIRKSLAPSLRTMERWVFDGIAKATDGCSVEPDGTCPHGSRSWLLELGLI